MGLGAIGPAMVLGTMILVLLAIALVGIGGGVWYRRHATSANRWKGTLTIVFACVLPTATCCLGPDLLFFAVEGRFPLRGNPYDVIKVGMTKDEVVARFGQPHDFVIFLGENGQGLPTDRLLPSLAEAGDVASADEARVTTAESGGVTFPVFGLKPFGVLPLPVTVQTGERPVSPTEILLGVNTARSLNATVGRPITITHSTTSTSAIPG